MKIRGRENDEKIDLQMTPMIDIVFQLLIFFVMTFKIVLPEGDFNIRMPLAAENTSAESPEETPTLNLRMRANADGSLAEVLLGERSFGAKENTFRDLHTHIRGIVDDSAGPGTANEQEVEIDADYNLQYDHTIRAITALSGYYENGQRHKLIEKVKFAKPRAK